MMSAPRTPARTPESRCATAKFYIQQHYEKVFSGESIGELDGEREEELETRPSSARLSRWSTNSETYREAPSDDVHFIIRTYHTGIGTDWMAECIQRLGENV